MPPFVLRKRPRKPPSARHAGEGNKKKYLPGVVQSLALLYANLKADFTFCINFYCSFCITLQGKVKFVNI